MLIIGGSFGATGTITVGRSGNLIIRAARKAEYKPQDMQSAAFSAEHRKEFAIGYFILMGIILAFTGLLFAGIIGATIGLVIAAVMAGRTKQVLNLDVRFNDGKKFVAIADQKEIDRVLKYAP